MDNDYQKETKKQLNRKCLVIRNQTNKLFGAFPDQPFYKERAKNYIKKLEKTSFDKFRIVKE